MFNILTLNNISQRGLKLLKPEKYQVGAEEKAPDAILLRSYKMHDYEVPSSLKAVGRAGAGVNNIPVDKMTEKGIPVFNTPGANANAVKELVLAGMLLASRNICDAWQYAQKLEGDDAQLSKLVEDGKKHFVGSELPGKTLGVIGLGAIGVKVANMALSLGMNVIGYDPVITIQRAWELNSGVTKAEKLEQLIEACDFVTVHVPLNSHTENMINAGLLAVAKPNSVFLNFARGGIINDADMVAALDANKVGKYVTDFVLNITKTNKKVIALPHLGASTNEAEENCAEMVAMQIDDFLQNGNITNSVNFPDVRMFRRQGVHRIVIVNSNEPNMVAQITSVIGKIGLNIVDMINKSRGNIAYTLVDVEQPLSDAILNEIAEIKGIVKLRKI